MKRRTARVLALCLALVPILTFSGAAAIKTFGPKLAAFHGPGGRWLNREITAAAHASTDLLAPFAPAPQVRDAASSGEMNLTLLDEVGQLQRAVNSKDPEQWKQELHGYSGDPLRAALLNIHLGEWTLAHDQNPRAARHDFAVAEACAPQTDPRHGLAAYDSAMALYYEGAYGEAADAFHGILSSHAPQNGFQHRTCALWYRYAAVSAQYHRSHAKLGVPEPPRLDMNCGVAALAARLRVLSLPYDKVSLLKVCRVTGEGSTLQDIADAGPRLHLSIHVLSANEHALRILPKPLIAWVEHDHFVAVVAADHRGVTYLCSDCGAWPGGSVHLTWKQWRTLSPGIYAAVTRSHDRWNRAIAEALAHPNVGRTPPAVQVASAGSITDLSLAGIGPHLSLLAESLAGSIAHFYPTNQIRCGNSPDSLHQMGGAPNDCSNSQPCGADGGEPVNLATGEEDYDPAPDLVVPNPYGPPLTWARSYTSLRGMSNTYEADDFGIGWSHPYNIAVYDPSATYAYTPTQTTGTTGTGLCDPSYGASSSQGATANVQVLSYPPPQMGTKTLTMPNGAVVKIEFPDESKNPDTVYAVCTVDNNVDAHVTWTRSGIADPFGQYNVVLPDRTTWTFTVVPMSAGESSGLVTYTQFGVTYSLTQITDRDGHVLTLSYIYEIEYATITSADGDGNASDGYSLTIQGTDEAEFGPRISMNCSSTGIYGVPVGAPLINEIDAVRSDGQAYPLLKVWREGYSQLLRTGQYPVYPDGGAAGNIVAVSDPQSNRCVFYHDGGFPSTNLPSTITPTEFQDLDFVSQITHFDTNNGTTTSGVDLQVLVQTLGDPNNWAFQQTPSPGGNPTKMFVCTDAACPPMRYQHGYQNVENGDSSNGGETVAFLHTLIVPAPSGTANAAASCTINYTPGTGFVSSVVDGNGNTHAYAAVDGADTNVRFIDAADQLLYEHTVTFELLNSQLVETTDSVQLSPTAAETVLTIGYGTLNDLPASQDPGKATSITDGDGNTWEYCWDQYGNLVESKSPRGVITNVTWNYSTFPLGDVTSVQEGTKAPTSFVYDTASQSSGNQPSPLAYENWGTGRLSSETYPQPGTVTGQTQTNTYAYDSVGNPLTVIKPGNGLYHTMTTSVAPTYYNPQLMRMNGSVAVNGVLTSGLPSSVTDNAGDETQFAYDNSCELTSVTSPLNRVTSYRYNIAHQPVLITYPATGRTGAGQATTQLAYAYPDGPLVGETLYDESDNLVRSVARTLDSEAQVTHVVVSGPSGVVATSSIAYDGCNRVSSTTDANGHTTLYNYTALNTLFSVVSPNGDTVTYPAPDADGNQLARVDAHGTTRYAYAYDRLTDITYPSASNTAPVGIRYDDYGRPNTVTDGAGSTTYAFDDNDLPIQKQVQYAGLAAPLTLSYAYNPDGSVAQTTTPAGAFTYSYDQAGRLSGVGNPLGESTSWNYDQGDELIGQSQANDLTARYGYDALGAAKSIDYTEASNGPAVAGFDNLTYDGASNLASATVGGVGLPEQGTLSFTHDGQDRLTSEQLTATAGNSYAYAYGYDPAGNTTQMRVDAVPTANAADQIPQSGVTYDQDGNPSRFQGRPLTWDAEDRLVSIGTAETNAYTADGMRAAVTTSAGTTYFLYDGDTPVCEVNASGQVTAMNTWGANGLVSRTAAQGTAALSTQNSTFYTFDQRGATAQRFDLGGNQVSAHAYDTYGQPLGTNGPAADDPYSGYGGQEGYYNDQATGLYLLGHRFYDPSSGRFLNRDPAGMGNLYAYADGNPEDGGDPTGFYDFTIGPQNAPWLEFNNQVVNEGLRVGTGAVLYKFSGGYFNPGADVLCDPSFGVSSTLADISMNAGMLALGGIGEAAEAEEGVEIAEEAAEGLTCPCFVAGTMVEMADGSHKPIQDVHLGEQVMSRDPITGEVKPEPVAQVFTHPASNLVTVTLSDGETLTCTPSHPFYVSGQGFVPAGELTAGAKLVSGEEAKGGTGAKAVSVSRVAWQKETARTGTTGTGTPGAQTLVYNLGIASTHTYFVGSENGGVWVHNACNAQQEASAIRRIQNIITKHARLGPNGEVEGAIRDLQGNPVPKPGGGYYDHLNELEDSMRGLENHINTLRGCTSPAAVAARQQAIDHLNLVWDALDKGLYP